MIKKHLLRILFTLIRAIRPFLGNLGVCIHPVLCTKYSKHLLHTQPLLIALPCIALRLLSCNPIVAIVKAMLAKKRFSFTKKKVH